MSAAPDRIRVRMYTVGFGDCLLVTFGYPAPVDGRAERHVLIDFGSKDYAEGGPTLKDVAGFIRSDCGGELDVVVVSHRHQDHISGFAPSVGGDVIRDLGPKAVVRSWTEDPDLPAQPGPPVNPLAIDALHARSLDAGQALAGAIGALALPERASGLRRGLGALAAYEGPNQAAVDRLNLLSEGGRGRYASFGTDLDLDTILPGVKIDVLGPPLPSAWDAIRKQRAEDPEFWLRLAGLVPASLEAPGPPTWAAAGPGGGGVGADDGGGSAVVAPGPARWVIERVERNRLQAAMRIVRWLDKALNNTSVILLIEAAGRRMLFPGDAQIENWSYVLGGRPDSPDWVAKLASVDLYKVSHHGSRNGTPKLSLYPNWLAAGAAGGELLSMLSTLSGTFDDEHPVPAAALVTALGAAPLRLVSSQPPGAGPTAPHVDAVAGPGPGPFTIVPA